MTAHGTRTGIAVLLTASLLTMAGCGGAGYAYYEPIPYAVAEPAYLASIDVDNLSPEYVETFFLAPAATDLWSGELLGWPLAPGETAYVGDYVEDWYDAEADTEFGSLVQWFDAYALGGDVTVFEVW